MEDIRLSNNEIKKLIDNNRLDCLRNLNKNQLNNRDESFEESLTCYASSEGKSEAFKILYEKGVTFFGFDYYGEYLSIHNVICDDNVNLVKWFLEENSNLIDEIVHGWNLLHIAANNESISTMIYLIQKAPHFLSKGDNNCVIPLGSLIEQDEEKYKEVFSEYNWREDLDGKDMIRILSTLI